MAHAFRRRDDGSVVCRLEGEEKAIITQVAQETADLIRMDLGIDHGPRAVREAAASEDPLERLEAEFATREARAPRDAAVQRLFPAASEDPALAEEFRRLGQQDLADQKIEDLRSLMALMDASGPSRSEVALEDETAAIQMLRALNDVRLVLADRLGIERDGDLDTLMMLQEIGERVEEAGPLEPQPEDGPQQAGGDIVIAVYELLTWLQESLLRAL